ncbi:MAG: transcriptional regulator [Actinomycetota bacterium]|nr:transcriptional regulator [Actinomycetota bacterium]
MDVDERRRRARAARDGFLQDDEGGPVGRRGPAAAGAGTTAGVPEVVFASWSRSRTAGVDVDVYRVEHHDDVDYDSRLVRCARPVIERLSDDMVDVPVTIALADSRARIVDRLDCSTSVARVLDRIDFLKGFSFREVGDGGVGTNGIGTVYEAGASVAVVGAEHFHEALVKFACTGAPIIDPMSGRVEGVLDISSLAESWSPIMHTLVRSAADDIARNLLLERNQSAQALYEMYVLACARSHRAVMAVGRTSLMVNDRAQALFRPDEQFVLQQHARMLMDRRERSTDTVTLHSGRVVHLRVSRIVSGDHVDGVVLLLHETHTETHAETHPETADRTRAAPRLSRPSRPSPSSSMPSEHRLPSLSLPHRQTSVIAGGLRHPPTSITDGACPAWRRACADTLAALTARRSLLVIGESGTGRFTLLAELFQRAYPEGRCVALDAASITDGSRFLLREPDEGSGPTLFILRNLDALTTAGAELLDDVLTASGDDEHRFVAATLGDGVVDTPLPCTMVVRHFDLSVTLPPIRFRGDDLATLTARVLTELAPDRRVTLRPDTARLVARYGWPRNVTQLREALASALRKRPVGALEPDDLPGYCHTCSSRTFTPLEVTERDAIVRALAQVGNNRVQAATLLGLSRSSLYRKLDKYGITQP